VFQRAWFPSDLVGPTVVLRRHVPVNLGAFQRWYSDPEVARLTRYQDGPMGADEIERFFQVRALGSSSLAMGIHVRETGRLIGTCAFSQLDGDNGAALFHITIGERDAWGHGYGTEATRLMLEHAFRTLGLHRVALSVFAFNERAIRSYRKVGFVMEGRSREAIWRDGRWWDELHMSLLDHEWAVLRQASPVGSGPPTVAVEEVPAATLSTRVLRAEAAPDEALPTALPSPATAQADAAQTEVVAPATIQAEAVPIAPGAIAAEPLAGQ
jgi:RimJ/RimL family protein N-acetyltransferase